MRAAPVVQAFPTDLKPGYLLIPGAQAILIRMVWVEEETKPRTAVHDAPFQAATEENKAKWAAEDKKLSQKLAALEKKFGKKPTIIMVLTVSML
jgi:hypothetical protein